MIHRLILLSVMHCSLLFSQTQIAVVDFNALGVSNNDALALTNRLMIEMHRTNKFKVLEREMLDKVIEEQKFQLSGCNADQCLVKLGEIANVQQIVGGTISKVGNVFTITARLISVESGEVVESALFDYDGKIGALMKMGMANIASQLASIAIPQLDKKQLKSYSTANAQSSNSANTVTDVDGNVYGTIKIGYQVWMVENLRVTHYRDGTIIPQLAKNSNWLRTDSGAFCHYDDKQTNTIIYGALYNWYAVNDERNLAPEGWHIPTDDEWKELEIALGMNNSAEGKGWRGMNQGTQLAGKATLWNDEEFKRDTNFGISGFNALPSGYRENLFGSFIGIGYSAYFWSVSEVNIQSSWSRTLHTSYSQVHRDITNKSKGFSIRCVKD